MASEISEDDFELCKTFGAYSLESLIILALIKDSKKVFHYLDNLKKIKLFITGKDLLEHGFEPSKAYGEIFDYVLKSKIKNPKMKKSEELALIKDFDCN